MPRHRTRVGLHGRNDRLFTRQDYELVRRAKVETIKMLSITDVSVFERLRRENPHLEFIVRLYDDRFNRNSRPTPAQFAARMIPVMRNLRPYALKFEIHNEPNHATGLEGWGSSDSHARSFNSWYQQARSRLKRACPWAQLGFPGLALNNPHRDLTWLSICRASIELSDWLGCHCYWQHDNMLNEAWGLRFKLYHQRFPNKKIEITEFGNSTPGLKWEEMAGQYARYYQELNNYPYLGSASAFIASSPDPAWAQFVWLKEGGEMLPVVEQVGRMERRAVDVPEWPAPAQPAPSATERTFSETGKTVEGKFLEFFDNHGLDICGYPITDQIEEDGLPSQYFQRVALEELESGQIRLKPVGKEAWDSRGIISSQDARLRELSQLLFAVGPDAPPIKDIVDELPTHPTKRYPTRPLSAIRTIVIHHTATSTTITPERIASYQVTRKGMPGIGHHFYVSANGAIYQTNRLETESDHAFDRNRSSIGVCFTGNFSKSVPRTVQLEAGAKLCAWLLGSLGLSTTSIVGVSEFADTESPGAQWLKGERWKHTLLTRVRAALQASGAEYTALIASLQGQVRTLQRAAAAPGRGLDPLASDGSGGTYSQVRVSRPSMHDVIDQLPKHSENEYETRPPEDIRYLVIHHSAAPASAGPQVIAAYHVRRHEWPGIGYHFVVAKDGTLYQTNALETKSYHAARANPYGVGICFLGNFTLAAPPAAQIQAGAHLLAWLLGELNLPEDAIRGHRELMGTACPGNQWLSGGKWRAQLLGQVREAQQRNALPSPPEPSEAKPIYHYLLFWAHGEDWAVRDWLNAINYIGVFRPTVGFSAEDAARAQNVTIVGGTSGVSAEVENQLKAAGCYVERIVGKDDAETKRILDAMAQQGRRFLRRQE